MAESAYSIFQDENANRDEGMVIFTGEVSRPESWHRRMVTNGKGRRMRRKTKELCDRENINQQTGHVCALKQKRARGENDRSRILSDVTNRTEPREVLVSSEKRAVEEKAFSKIKNAPVSRKKHKEVVQNTAEWRCDQFSADLPQGWYMMWSYEHNHSYYYNEHTDTSTWNRPSLDSYESMSSPANREISERELKESTNGTDIERMIVAYPNWKKVFGTPYDCSPSIQVREEKRRSADANIPHKASMQSHESKEKARLLSDQPMKWNILLRWFFLPVFATIILVPLLRSIGETVAQLPHHSRRHNQLQLTADGSGEIREKMLQSLFLVEYLRDALRQNNIALEKYATRTRLFKDNLLDQLSSVELKRIAERDALRSKYMRNKDDMMALLQELIADKKHLLQTVKKQKNDIMSKNEEVASFRARVIYAERSASVRAKELEVSKRKVSELKRWTALLGAGVSRLNSTAVVQAQKLRSIKDDHQKCAAKFEIARTNLFHTRQALRNVAKRAVRSRTRKNTTVLQNTQQRPEADSGQYGIEIMSPKRDAHISKLSGVQVELRFRGMPAARGAKDVRICVQLTGQKSVTKCSKVTPVRPNWVTASKKFERLGAGSYHVNTILIVNGRKMARSDLPFSLI